ncbi:MAG TPA: ABC transporter substrate-binding protein [Natronosporangium sp.]|nr:ABC transporter substrate-binding protein [Natronosporangium sp.]
MASRSTAVSVLAASALVLTACSGDGSDGGGGAATPVEDGTLVTAVAGDPGNLDPHMTVLALTRYVGTYMYDQLILIDEEGELRPWLAESWQEEPGSVTFTLREGITCSDGSPLTASDVAANVDFVADPANQSPLLGLWVQPGVTTSADDAARTVTVTAGSPDPFLLQGLALLPIVCAAGMADRDSLAHSGNGTGMFTLEEAVPGERYTFQRRDDYAWGPDGASASDPGTPATVIIRVVPDESTAVNLFLSGEVDLLAVTGPDQDRITAPDVRRYDVRTLFSQLIFNQADGRPGADPAVRRALVQAVDWDEVGAVMTGGKGQPPTGLGVLEPKVCPADTVTGTIPPHDPAAAATVLDDAGWVADGGVRSRDGEPLALTLVYSSEAGSQLAAGVELVSQRWQELGVEVELRPVTSVQANEVLFGTGAWDAVILSLNVAFPSQLTGFFGGPPPPDGTNFGAIANERYTSLTAAAMQQPGAAGCGDWAEAERALIGAADVTPIVDSLLPYFADGVELRLNAGSPAPPTLRLFTR